MGRSSQCKTAPVPGPRASRSGAQFLGALAELIEEPLALLV